MSFSLIENHQLYCQNIRARCDNLIHLKVWSGFDYIQIENWLSNFHTNEEVYFAHRLLDNMIFRSEKQVVSMIKQLFQRILPDLFNRHSIPLPDDAEDISKCVGNRIAFVAAVKPEDHAGKSAAIIARKIKKIFDINVIYPRDIPEARAKNANVFIFVDDLLASGTQFDEVLIQNNISTWPDNEKFIYAPLVAHETGVNYLQNFNQDECREMYPNLIIDAPEWLSPKNQVFHQSSSFFADGINTGEIAKKFYYSILKKYKINNPRYRRGYKNLELCYAFDHATPDNNLSILWTTENNWKPLFQR